MSDPHLSQSIFGADEAPARTAETVRRRRRHRGPVGCIVVLLALLLAGGAAVYAVGQLKPVAKSLFGGPEDYARSETSAKKTTVKIASGQGATAIGNQLTKAGVVKSSEAFVAAARANDKWSKMQPGTYALPLTAPAADVVALLVDPKNKTTKLVTVPEGLRKWETYALLAKATGRPVAEYEAAEKQAATLGLPAEADGDVEGYLYPMSYEFAPTTTAAEQLKAMFAQGAKVRAELGIPADRLKRTVVIASIVQAEGKLPADLPKIARVVENRIDNARRLEMDSTVVYPVKKRVLATTDADRALVNGYNTYKHDGLPVGAISNPGEAALKAALHPAEGPWLYFVAVNPTTGETKFASTLAEHNRYVREWQQYCQENKGSC